MGNASLFPNNPNLAVLDISNRNLTELPNDIAKRYPKLVTLHCANNKLMTLPDILPPNLTSLSCNNNELISLPNELPNGLLRLDCSNNNIEYLPETLPSQLFLFKFDKNPLIMPDELYNIYVSSNNTTNDFDYTLKMMTFYRDYYLPWRINVNEISSQKPILK